MLFMSNYVLNNRGNFHLQLLFIATPCVLYYCTRVGWFWWDSSL